MTKDLSAFSWRVGMVLIVAMPLLYIAPTLASFAVRYGQHPLFQLILSLNTFVPHIFISIALGCALCLLVRIERHLRLREETH